jgi:rhodanese-related sulfurtransferase
VTCYAGFFDQLYGVLQNELEPDLEKLSDQLSPAKVCDAPVTRIAERSEQPVHEYSIDHILKMIDADKNVVFVDTRESDEYDEHHIPGAINLTLREVNQDSAKQFTDADLVISYCVKDFRGYEVALALHKAGVKHSGIMKPYGIRGWKSQGLPVVEQNADSDVQALALLKQCAARGQCGQT